MTNMSYCRFRNTVLDLRDCYENMEEEPASEEEKKARLRLIKRCCEVADAYGYEVGFGTDS